MSVKSSIQFFVIFLSPLRKKKYFHFVGWIDAYVNKITQDFLNRMDVHEMFCEWQIRFFLGDCVRICLLYIQEYNFFFASFFVTSTVPAEELRPI